MFGFLMRKTLYDLWDNFLKIAAANLGFILLMAGFFQLPALVARLVPSVPALQALPLLLFALAGILYCAALAHALCGVSDYEVFQFSRFAASFKKALPLAAALAVFAAFAFLLSRLIIPFYLNLSGFIGSFSAATLFWLLVVLGLTVQFLPAICVRLDLPFKEKLKYCFFFMADNTPFLLGIFLTCLFILGISVLFVLLWPGIAGVLLFLDEAFRLRQLKYQWLASQGESASTVRRKKIKIPWDEILEYERETTGKRTLRQFIFPWK